MTKTSEIWKRVIFSGIKSADEVKRGIGPLTNASATVVVKSEPGEHLEFWDRPGFIRESILSGLKR